VHPAIAESCASAVDGVVSDLEGCDCLALAAVEGPDLLRRFAEVSDGRSDQGRDHPVAVVLTLCAAAVLAGMRWFTAIAGWVADVPAALMAELYGTPLRASVITARPRPPNCAWISTLAPARAVVPRSNAPRSSNRATARFVGSDCSPCGG
jgi:hypothetical protein